MKHHDYDPTGTCGKKQNTVEHFAMIAFWPLQAIYNVVGDIVLQCLKACHPIL